MPFMPLSALYTTGAPPTIRPSPGPTPRTAWSAGTEGAGADHLVPGRLPGPYSDVENLIAAYRAGGTDVTVEPSHCGVTDVLTDPTGGHRNVGMQNVDWFVGKFEETTR